MSLSINHWKLEGFTQRLTTKQWKEVLLDELDRIIVNGYLRHLRARKLGAGVVEIYKEPLQEGQTK